MREDNQQYAPETHSHMVNLYQNYMYEYIKKQNRSTVWEETYGCAS